MGVGGGGGAAAGGAAGGAVGVCASAATPDRPVHVTHSSNPREAREIFIDELLNVMRTLVATLVKNEGDLSH
jgi:hypothetical protein